MRVLPSESAELWEAARTIEMHAPDLGRCAQCGDNPADCRRLRWADVILREWQARTGKRRPEAAPAWTPEKQPQV